MSRSSAQHQAHAASRARERPVRCAVLTVSDSRTLDNDQGGALIVTHLESAGHIAAARTIVPDEATQIRAQIEQWLGAPAIDAILTTGGTGIARRDSTIEVVRSLLTAELEGFGELFRMLSYQQVGAAAMLSRALAGLATRRNNAGAESGDR